MPIFHNGQWFDDQGRAVGGSNYFRAQVALVASGQVVAAVPNKKIRVIAVWANASAICVGTFQTGSGADISAPLFMANNGGAVMPKLEEGWFETLAGEALNLDIAGGATVGAQVLYALV